MEDDIVQAIVERTICTKFEIKQSRTVTTQKQKYLKTPQNEFW